MKKRLHFLILVILSLLQCVAPFAHAHVDGHSEDHHVHLAALDLHHDEFLSDVQADVVEEEDHSQSVGVQTNYRCKHIELSDCIPAAELHIPVAPEALICIFSFPAIAESRHFISFLHPDSQAPPA